MIQSFNDYLAARQVEFHESERIQQLELAVWANPKIGPEARARSDVTIKMMKANLAMLTEVIADYEDENITPTLRTRMAARTASSDADSDGEDTPRVVRRTRDADDGGGVPA